MSDESEKNGRSLAEQLEDLEVDASDREEPSASDRDAATAEAEEDEGEETEESTPSPEQQFEAALDDLSDEDLRAKKFDRGREEAGNQGGGASDSEADEADGTTGDGVLAEELEEFDADGLPERRSDGAPVEPGSESGPAEEASEPRRPDSLEEALDGMSPSEMRARKFDAGDASQSAAPEGEEPSDSTESAGGSAESNSGDGEREVDEAQRRQFERAMHDVDRMEGSSKYRGTDAPDPDAYLEEESSRTAEEFATPRLPKSGEGLNEIPKLDEAQKAMLERCEQWEERRDVPELNLRGERVDEAVERLARFVEQACAEGTRFVRIVHGRGRRSDGPPVIKPAVLEWLEGSAADRIRGYVPERQFGGDYGSTVVEFREAS